jgi:hypothetical protein
MGNYWIDKTDKGEKSLSSDTGPVTLSQNDQMDRFVEAVKSSVIRCLTKSDGTPDDWTVEETTMIIQEGLVELNGKLITLDGKFRDGIAEFQVSLLQENGDVWNLTYRVSGAKPPVGVSPKTLPFSQVMTNIVGLTDVPGSQKQIRPCPTCGREAFGHDYVEFSYACKHCKMFFSYGCR